MSTSDRVDELVFRFFDALEDGKEISPTELTRDCPELRPLLEQQLRGHAKYVAWEREQQSRPVQNDFGSLRLEPGFEPRPGYRLVEYLGGGASGEVWKAEREGHFHVALKFISLQKPAGTRELGSLEWVKTLRHGNLLTVSATWFLGSVLVIETDWAEYSLRQRWQQCRGQGLPGIPVNELIGYLSDIADVLDDLYKQGIVHRDIKPENILVKGGKARLGDLGVILFLSNHDPLRDPWCTREYAAPEVQRGEFNATTDQYALLVTYCELLTGDYPYELVDRWPNYPGQSHHSCLLDYSPGP